MAVSWWQKPGKPGQKGLMSWSIRVGSHGLRLLYQQAEAMKPIRTRESLGTVGGEGVPKATFLSGISAAGAVSWLPTVSLLPHQGVSLSCPGMPVILSQEVESVLVGAAILGACASGDFVSVQVCKDRGEGRGPSPVWVCPSSWQQVTSYKTHTGYN